MLNKYKKFTLPKDTSRISSSEKGNTKSISKREAGDRWRQEIESKWVQKAEVMQKTHQQITKLIENKNVLVNKLREKNKEIRRLENEVSLLLRELSTLKTDHLQALEEIKSLKIKLHESARNSEMVEQQKTLHDKAQKELIKSQQLITKEKLKTRSLESLKLNPHRWRTMPFADPNYFEVLLKKNHLQKELLKKLDLIREKNGELDEKNNLLKNMQSMLKRRPYNLLKDPTEQMAEFYKAMQLQNKKIKILTMQKNMFESVFPDQFHKLRS